MRWIVPNGLPLLAACGAKIAQHSGYKHPKSKPWKSAKAIKLDDKRQEGKIDGFLDYAKYDRAKWYYVQIPSHGELDLSCEVTPGDNASDDFDMALEVLDPGFRVISKSDKEEEDAGELTKTKTLFDLDPGKYYIHLYLQSRIDTADYYLKVKFKPTTAPEEQSNFPDEVAFVPNLPMVPLNDDTPRKYRPKVVVHHRRPIRKPQNKDPEKPAPTILSARIVGVSVVGGGTRVVLGRGTLTGAASGMRAKLKGINGSFPIDCNENTCTAVVSATPDQVKGGGTTVTLLPGS